MSESVVADFVASARYDAVQGTQPVRTRILLSEDRLVLVSDAGRTVVPMHSVADVISSGVPAELGGFFDQSVMIAYDTEDGRRTAVVSGDHDPVDQFALYLYKAALRGGTVRIRHPVRVGGRVLDPDWWAVAATPTASGVRFSDGDSVLEFGLDEVVEVTHDRRPIEGRERPVLAVSRHVEGTTETTEIRHDNPNHLTLLARHLRSEYEGAADVLQEADLAEHEIAALVALYGGVEPDALDRVLAAETVTEGADAGDVLSTLHTHGLIRDVDSGVVTHEGALVAIHRMTDVAE